MLPATSIFPVSTTLDNGLPGSLRYAIEQVNMDTSANLDVIDFHALPAGLTGVVTLAVNSPLPAIRRGGVVVDGTTAVGFAGAPVVEINGTNAGANASGLVLAAPPTGLLGGDTVQGLIIDGFGQNGIVINSSNANQIFDVYSGTAASPNLVDGIYVTAGSSFNVIGGARTLAQTQTGDANTPVGGASGRNVFSGNGDSSFLNLNPTPSGIELFGPGTGFNTVTNNVFGLDAAATNPVPNLYAGVFIHGGTTNNVVQGNIIAGNSGPAVGYGVVIEQAGTEGNVLSGNLIGLNISRVAAANAGGGVLLMLGATGNSISGNTISGNSGAGISIQGAGTSGNTVQGNAVGTDGSLEGGTGRLPIPNTGDGIDIMGGASGNTIGGAGSAAANVIAGNLGNGINLNGMGTDGNLVQGNFIGVTAATGGTILGNVVDGVQISSEASSNGIGGTSAGQGNYILGNGGNGVTITGSSTTGNVVRGNWIGVDGTLTSAAGAGNKGFGVVVAANASGNDIGGPQLLANGAAGNPANSNLAVSNFIWNNLAGQVNLTGAGADNPVQANSIFGPELGIQGSLLAAPNLQSVTTGAGETTISGTFSGTPGSYLVQVFGVPASAPASLTPAAFFLTQYSVAIDSDMTTGSLDQVIAGLAIANLGDARVAVTVNEPNIDNSSPFSSAVVSTFQGRVFRDDAVGVFRQGQFILNASGSGTYSSADLDFAYGLPTDTPVTGSWTGGALSEIGVFRQGTWVLNTTGTGSYSPADLTFTFGAPGDIPVVGDWLGNGVTNVGVVRVVNGALEWILDTNGTHHYAPDDATFFFGAAGDIPVTGEFNAPSTPPFGRTDIGIFRNGTWVLDQNQAFVYQPGVDPVFVYGTAGDTPVTGHWNGGPVSEVGVFRNTGGLGQFILNVNGTNTYSSADPSFVYGLGTDVPVIGEWAVTQRATGPAPTAAELVRVALPALGPVPARSAWGSADALGRERPGELELDAALAGWDLGNGDGTANSLGVGGDWLTGKLGW